MRGISDGAADLADGDAGGFMNKVALRTAPPRSSTTPKKKPDPKTDAAPEPAPEPAEDTRSPLQKLADKFR